jgi:hypothetical protein
MTTTKASKSVARKAAPAAGPKVAKSTRTDSATTALRPKAAKSSPKVNATVTPAPTPAKARPQKAASTAAKSNGWRMDGLHPKDLVVQSDLAIKEARDQWSRMTAELERRRRNADKAVRQLRDTSADASHALMGSVREAVGELSNAVEAMFGKPT